jgi:hypothetical protein
VKFNWEIRVNMKNIKYRLILPMQAKGNMGKSIEAAARACWLNQRGIPWQGFDLDGDNSTFSRLFPDMVTLTPLAGQAGDMDELIAILRRTTAKPVTIVDPRAHLDTQITKALASTHFFDIASTLNIGITLMVFPFDDLDVMDNLDAVCRFCGNEVDYVIIRNPARAPKSRMFDGSELEKELANLGAVRINIPVLSEFVKLRLAKLESDHQRGIPFNEAIGNDSLGLDIMARGVLQDWLLTLFHQYDQIAAKLLPTEEAAAIRPREIPPIGEPMPTKRGAKVNLTA